MEKLIELLNEYEEKYRDFHFIGEWRMGNELSEFEIAFIISKKFWFIQWLVENEKIDTTNLQDYWDRWEMWIWVFANMYKSDLIILTLAIQDNPIEFLASILK